MAEEEAYPASVHDYSSDADELLAIDAAASEAPRGAVILSALSVAALLAGWLILYFFVFIPRGTVG